VAVEASTLTDYVWKYRYPGQQTDPPRAEAESALALARKVYDAIIARLPAEVRPTEPVTPSPDDSPG
jgi:hypothetical protein